ncbi:MAG: hypothetical protein CL764_06750 [Chloroflexi bacterium]|nr:hypothetical protein [Chloroflexota bacterium]
MIFYIFIFTSLSCSSSPQIDQVQEKNDIQFEKERRGPPPDGGERRGPPPDGRERRGPPPDGRERRGPPPDRNFNKPMYKYSCEINGQGFCIFSGSPHINGLKPNSEEIIDRDLNILFSVNNAIAVNSSGEVLKPSGKPASNGDYLIESYLENLTKDEISFHKVMAIMFPIRNALMYDIEKINMSYWENLVIELKIRNIKDSTYTEGPTPRDNFYSREGIFDLAKNPNQRDIHHDVMKFLEESGIHLLCHVTSEEFNNMLRDSHPEGHDPCKEAEITNKIPF